MGVMTAFKRHWLIYSVVAILFFAGWVYYTFYLTTSHVLSRAEAFSFRRMTVAQLEEPDQFRFFYVTNRHLLSNAAEFDLRFDHMREGHLKFGSFDSSIEASVGLDMIINPKSWFQNEKVELLDVQPLDKKEWISQIQSQIAASPFKSLLVVVHGFKEAFPTALRKTAFLSHILDINTPVLVFDWPANQGTLLLGYRKAQSVAEASGAELAASLNVVVNDIKPEKVWIIANSMGAQVVVDALSLLYQRTQWSDTQIELDNVVLTAPDVDHHEFKNRFKQEIKALTRQLNIYVSSNDRALLISRYVNRSRRFGESTLQLDAKDEAVIMAELVHSDNQLINMIDVTPINRTRNFHSFSMETPEFFDDLYLRLTNIPTPHSRLLYKTTSPEGAVYSVLTRGR